MPWWPLIFPGPFTASLPLSLVAPSRASSDVISQKQQVLRGQQDAEQEAGEHAIGGGHIRERSNAQLWPPALLISGFAVPLDGLLIVLRVRTGARVRCICSHP